MASTESVPCACCKIRAAACLTWLAFVLQHGCVFASPDLEAAGSALPVPASGDANSDDVLTAADIVPLVNYVFKSGSPPGYS